MGIRKFKPTTPGRRFGSCSDFEEITRTTPEKSLLRPKRKRGGRNHHGHITCRGRGGGHKKHYRVIDFKRRKDSVPARVDSIEYDPNRSCRIALLVYADGEKRYILAPLALKVGDTVVSGERVEPKVGNCMPLASIPLGMSVHNVEMHIGKGGQLGRSAGTAIVLQAREKDQAHLVLPSGEIRKVHVACRATIGQLGNIEHNQIVIGNAGRNRHRGWRPMVRGVAQNPVDHPMGGGEGKTSGGRHPCSPWGKLSKGGKTRKRKNPSNKHIIRRRKKRN